MISSCRSRGDASLVRNQKNEAGRKRGPPAATGNASSASPVIPNIPARPGSPPPRRHRFATTTDMPVYFWPGDISLVGGREYPIAEQVLTAGQVTGHTYLLALAVDHGGHLATFDRAVDKCCEGRKLPSTSSPGRITAGKSENGSWPENWRWSRA